MSETSSSTSTEATYPSLRVRLLKLKEQYATIVQPNIQKGMLQSNNAKGFRHSILPLPHLTTHHTYSFGVNSTHKDRIIRLHSSRSSNRYRTVESPAMLNPGPSSRLPPPPSPQLSLLQSPQLIIYCTITLQSHYCVRSPMATRETHHTQHSKERAPLVISQGTHLRQGEEIRSIRSPQE